MTLELVAVRPSEWTKKPRLGRQQLLCLRLVAERSGAMPFYLKDYRYTLKDGAEIVLHDDFVRGVRTFRTLVAKGFLTATTNERFYRVTPDGFAALRAHGFGT